MDPLTMGAVVAGGSVAGGLFANEQNSQQAGLTRAWQQYMSGTAHQREVQDLRAAGLNPVLSAMGGPGASTPSGATAQMNNPAEGISKGMDTAIAIRDQNKNLSFKDSQIENLKAETYNKQETAGLIGQQKRNAQLENQQLQMQNKLLLDTLPSQIQKAKAEGDWSEVNQIMGIINSGASSAAQILNPLKGMDFGGGKILDAMKKIKIKGKK